MRRRFTRKEIARELGLNYRTVCKWLQRPRGKEKVRVLEKHLIRYHKALRIRRSQRLSIAAIARRLRIHPRTVSYWLKKEAL